MMDLALTHSFSIEILDIFNAEDSLSVTLKPITSQRGPKYTPVREVQSTCDAFVLS